VELVELISSPWPYTIVGEIEGMAGYNWGVIYTRVDKKAYLDIGNIDLLECLPSI
jgi:hypothetical protein